MPFGSSRSWLIAAREGKEIKGGEGLQHQVWTIGGPPHRGVRSPSSYAPDVGQEIGHGGSSGIVSRLICVLTRRSIPAALIRREARGPPPSTSRRERELVVGCARARRSRSRSCPRPPPRARDPLGGHLPRPSDDAAKHAAAVDLAGSHPSRHAG